MSPLWSDVAIANALKAAAAARQRTEAANDDVLLKQVGNGWVEPAREAAPRRPIRRAITSFAL